MGQAKYFTLLRYADSTAMEVDLWNRHSPCCYAASSNFSALKSGDRFEDVLKNFAENLHTRRTGKACFIFWDRILEQFLDDGLMKRSRKFRIYNRRLKTYGWCQCTIIQNLRRAPLPEKDHAGLERVEGSGELKQPGTSRIPGTGEQETFSGVSSSA